VNLAGVLLVATRGYAMSVSYRKLGSANGNRMRIVPVLAGAVGCKSLQTRPVGIATRLESPRWSADVVTRLSLVGSPTRLPP
jgi:hypothetical protein